MTPPVFYLLAGPNGAGKSTLYRAAVSEGLIPANIEFVNADLFEAAELTQVVDPKERSEQARLWADRRRGALLAAGRSFVSETVFSHPSKLQLLKDSQAAGFRTVLWWFAWTMRSSSCAWWPDAGEALRRWFRASCQSGLLACWPTDVQASVCSGMSFATAN